MLDLINEMPDMFRVAILPVIRILALIYGWSTVYEDGSVTL